MAVRFTADSQKYTSTSLPPSTAAWTVVWWFKLSVDRNPQYVIMWDVVSGSNFTQIGVAPTGNRDFEVAIQTGGNDTEFLTTVGQWYCVAVSQAAGGGTNSMTIYTGTDPRNLTSRVRNGNPQALTQLTIGGSGGSTVEWFNGAIANFKQFSSVLTIEQIASELNQYQPTRSVDLVRWHPFINAETTDYSGNGRTLSGGTGVTAEDGPPIKWGKARSPKIKGNTQPPPGVTHDIGPGATQNHFKLQVGRTGDSSVLEVSQDEISAGYTESPYYYTTADGLRVHFESRLDAPRTSGSSFSRTESREVNADGTDISWNPQSGEHIFEGSVIVTELPPVKPDAVFFQAFGETATADIVSLRTQLVSGSIRMRLRINGVSITSPQIAAPYTIGTRVNFRARFISGFFEFYFSTGTDTLPTTPQITSTEITETSAYFKYGLYNQSNVAAGDAGAAIGSAEHYKPTIIHNPPTDVEVTAGAIDTTVEVLAVDPAKIIDLDLITVTSEPLGVTQARSLDAVPVDVTSEPLPAQARRGQVLRPPLLTAAFVEALEVTFELTQDVTVILDIVEVNVSLIANQVELEKIHNLGPDTVVNSTVQVVDVDVAHLTKEPIDPQFITVEPLDVSVLQTAFGLQNISVQPIPQDVKVGKYYNVDIIHIETTALAVTHLRELSLDPVDITIEPTFTTVIQTIYTILPIDINLSGSLVDQPVNVELETEVAEIAIQVVNVDQPVRVRHVVNLQPIEIDTSSALQNNELPVITYGSYRVGIVTVSTELAQPDLAHVSKIANLVDISILLTGQSPDLAHLADLGIIQAANVQPRPVSSQGFDDEPINVEIEVLPVDVGFSVEDFSFIRGLRVEPFVEPARVIAQDIRTKKFLHWELPVSNLSISYSLSGPTVISGEFSNEILDLRDAGLEPEATWIHVEENGFIRASGILQPTSVDQNETLSLEAVGPSSYPSGQPYDGKFEGINLDPADIIRLIWSRLQSYDDANLGVQVTGNTPVRLGKPLPPAPPSPLPEGYVDPNPNDNNDKPYSLLWWEAPDCGDEINKLISEAPMDYVERAQWNSDKTDVLHFIDLGFPRIGRKRDDISFVQDENLLNAIGPEEIEGFYASAVILMGKGEGSSIIRGYAAAPNPRRIRKVVILNDSTVDNVARANALCLQELNRRQAVLDITEIEAEARHINARLGSFSLGDDVVIRGRVPWVYNDKGDSYELFQWERIVGYTYLPDTESLRVRLRRSESFSYGTGAR